MHLRCNNASQAASIRAADVLAFMATVNNCTRLDYHWHMKSNILELSLSSFFSPVLKKHCQRLYFFRSALAPGVPMSWYTVLFLFFQICTGTKDANILALRVSQRVYFSRSALAPGMPISWPWRTLYFFYFFNLHWHQKCQYPGTWDHSERLCNPGQGSWSWPWETLSLLLFF